MAPVSLDTNCLLRWCLDDIPDQSQAVRQLFDNPTPKYVSDVVLAEMVFVLEKVYKLKRLSVAGYIELLTSIDTIRCSAQTIQHAIRMYQDNLNMSFVDCFALADAQMQNRLPLYTFDKKLIRHSSGSAKEVPAINNR